MAITVNAVHRRVQYTSSGSLGPYSFAFKVLASADIRVYVGSTQKTVTTHYTTSLNADGTGSVTFTSGNAPASSTIVTIESNQAIERTSDYTTGGDFKAASINDDLDSLAINDQQLETLLSRNVQLASTVNRTTSGSGTSGPLYFPYDDTVANNASKVVSFDAAGTALVATQELGELQGNWAASTAYVLRDIVKDTSNNNIYICITAHTSSGSQPISSNTDAAKWSLIVDAASATTSAAAAATSATAAATSATAAATSATSSASSASTATTQASNASTSASTASTQASNASTSASAAATSATAAATSATAAATSATSAATSRTAAETAETNAETAETNAETAETNAETAETNAAASASTASTQASNAATSATAAAASATTATTQASTATSQATAAAASAAAAAASADTFDDIYLGAKSSAPSVDNDGDALTAGDLYFNTSTNVMNVYTGSAWIAAAVSSAAVVEKTAATGSGVMPSGTTVQRDGSPAVGYFRYNSTTNEFEGYAGASPAWGSIGGGAGYFKGENGTVGSSAGDIFRVNEAELNTSTTILAAENASATGPLTIASGVTLTVSGTLAII